MAKKLIIVTFIFALVACDIYKQEKVEVVAEVGDKKLSKLELAEIIPADANANDSLFIADNYIRQWITKQLIVNKAEAYLSEEQKDVQKLVEDYRNSLLIHIYLQNFVQQKLDTVVTEEQVKSYCKQYPNNFSTNENLIKAIFIKVKKPLFVKETVVKWLKSNKKKDRKSLEEFCLQRAVNYDTFKDNWVVADKVLNQLPLKIKDKKQFLMQNKHIVTSDVNYYYFLKINDLRFRNSTTPLNYIVKDAKKIILNKRKLKLVNSLEKDIYNDAKNKRKFKIY